MDATKKIDVILLNAIDRYFTHLHQFGKISSEKQDSIMALLLIKQILLGPMKTFVVEADYRVMENVLYCLIGSSCLVDYYEFKETQTVVVEDIDSNDLFKILEDGITQRLTESSEFRFQL